MRFRIGLENNVEGRSLAWSLDYPGLFAYGADGPAALAAFPAAAQDYAAWAEAHEEQFPFDASAAEISLEETWECFQVDETFERVDSGYEINAWFLNDWKPLSEQDVVRGCQILGWSRRDLIRLVDGLSAETLATTYPDERWNIAGILKHIASADWWYMDRLGLAMPRTELPDEPLMRLDAVRGHLLKVLPTLAGLQRVVGVDAEFWSPRKLLRRSVWHERDHIEHIRKLLR